LLLLPSGGFCGIEGYFEGHASVRVPCDGSLGRVERSQDNHTRARAICFGT
jgi:hypothetical protein